jgi:hypothetical protein
MFKLKLLVQRKNVDEGCKKPQALMHNELDDITFMLCPDSKYLLFTNDIFHKQKRQTEEDVTGKQSQELILKVENSQSPTSFVSMMEQETSTALNQMQIVILGSQSSPEAEVSQNTSDVQAHKPLSMWHGQWTVRIHHAHKKHLMWRCYKTSQMCRG